jgi:hypothetical protein
MAKKRTNVIPIIEDARYPNKYRMLMSQVDVIFADVAQPDQARIVALNAHHFLKNGGHVVVSIKASCIDSTAPAEAVFASEVKRMVEENIKPHEQLTLEPYERTFRFARSPACETMLTSIASLHLASQVTTPWSSDRTSATSKRAQYRRSLPSPHYLPPPCMRLSIVPLRRPPAYLVPSPFLARLKPQASRPALFLVFLAFAHLHPFLSHPLKKRDLMIRSETNQTGWPVWERRGPHRRSERSAARQDTTLIADLRPVCWRQPCLLERQTVSIYAVRGLLCDAGRRRVES